MLLGKEPKNKHSRIFFIEVQMIRWAYETELKKGKVKGNITFNQLHSIVNRHFPSLLFILIPMISYAPKPSSPILMTRHILAG
jgi:hypothetical protein